MAGEARKAAAQKAIDVMLETRGMISRAERLAKMEAIFAEYAAETREQCAQIAESEKVDYEATKDEGDLAYNSAIEHVAAAIRSIAQQDSANEGE